MPYTPEHNGVAERFNRTVIEKARTMLFGSGLAKFFWDEAVYPTKDFVDERAKCTAAELWFGKKPNISKLKVFGSVGYTHVPKELRKKLDSKSTKNIMVG